jgi:HSP20 family protein
MESQSQPEQSATSNPGKGNGKRASSGSETQGKQGSNEQAMQGEVMSGSNQSGQSGAVQIRGDRRIGRYSRDPFELLDQLANEMDQFFSSPFSSPSLLRRRSGSFNAPAMWAPDIDVREEGNQLRICADLPGISKDQVKVDVEDGMVTIQGERQEERTERSNDQRFRRVERRYGSFYRTIPLPDSADAEKAKASMKEGVLEITIPLAQKSQQRRLEVQG